MMRSFSVRATAVVALVVVATGCGSEGPGVTAGRSETTATQVQSTTIPPSTTTLAPATTVAPTTTSTTAAATTTTIAVTPTGWRDVVLDGVPSEAFPPCCASNWSGSPSPALPESGDIPDGVFNARRVAWDPNTAQLAIEARRFEACGILPSESCEPSTAFYPDEMGIDDTVVRSMNITLDSSVRVVVIGWDNDAVAREASGADLAATFVSLQHAYNDVVATPFNSGIDADTIVRGLLAAPAEGFGPPSVEMYGALIYSSDGAPPLLFQYVIDYTESGDRVLIDPTEVANLTVVEFDQGSPTLYFYAGYYP